MKVIVYALLVGKREFSLGSNPNIRELRTKIAKEFDTQAHLVQIKSISDQAGTRLGTIYFDDPGDEELLHYLRRINKNPELKLDELFISIDINMALSHRPTKQNPLGESVRSALANPPISPFFKAIIKPQDHPTFKSRLAKIKFPNETEGEEIPNRFLDVITFEMMELPIITSTQRVYDTITVPLLNNKDPETRERFEVVGDNLLLRAEMEDFVEEKERLFLEKQKSSAPAPSPAPRASEHGSPRSALTTPWLTSDIVNRILEEYKTERKKGIGYTSGDSNSVLKILKSGSKSLAEKQHAIEAYLSNPKNMKRRLWGILEKALGLEHRLRKLT